MCRRRILAIILSLALVASCFVFSVSADNTEFDNFLITVNGNAYPLVEGGFTADFIVPANGTLTVTISTFGSSKGSFSAAPLAVNLVIQPYIQPQDASINSSDILPTNISNANNTYLATYTVNLNYVNSNDRVGYYNQYEYRKCPTGFYITGLVADNYRSIGQSCIWKNYSSGSVAVKYHFEQVSISLASNWFYGQILMPALNVMQNTLSSINSAVTSVNNALILNDNYSYFNIGYNSNGDAIVTEILDVSWYEAVIGNLLSLSAPVAHQVEQEQLAKDAGFEDVLDDAYDKSNPGDFLDFLDIGDIATWNEEAYEHAQGDALTYWFSQSCKDNIDSVPVVRGQEPQVIDFYSTHISEYWEALGIDTTDSGSD